MEQLQKLKISCIGSVSDVTQNSELSRTDSDDQIIFTQDCDLSTAYLLDGKLVIDVESLIDLGRRRAHQDSATLIITAFVKREIGQEMVDRQNFDGINPFEALREDHLFSGGIPDARLSNNYKKLDHERKETKMNEKMVIRLPVQPLLRGTIQSFQLASTAMMEIRLKTMKVVTIESIIVLMAGAIVTPFVALPITVDPEEDFSALYEVRLFEQREQREISFQIKTSDQMSYFCARFYSPDGLVGKTIINHGRLFEGASRKEEMKRGGLEVSVNVKGDVEMHKIFSVEVLITNRTTRKRNLTVTVPEVKAEILRLKKREFPHLQMDEDEVRLRLAESEIKSKMVCMEKELEVSVKPAGCRLVTLHFVVVQGHQHKIPNLLLKEEGKEFWIKDAGEIYVQ